MKRRGHHIDGLMALLLFGIFAACVLAVLLTGADTYRRLTERDQEAYHRRVSAQYIAARVRQADRAEGVSIQSFGGGDALRLADGTGYATLIYLYDGWLMELYASEDSGLAPEDGARVMESQAFALSMEEEGLLEVRLTGPTGTEDTLRLCLRSGEGAAA